MTYTQPTRRRGETHAICYNYGDEIRILQWDNHIAATRNLKIVNDQEEANGRPRKFWMEERP